MRYPVCTALSAPFLAIGGTASVQAATFTFSFDNVGGTVPGTVSGSIVLPDGDGTFAATSVILESIPAGLGYDAGFVPRDLPLIVLGFAAIAAVSRGKPVA